MTIIRCSSQSILTFWPLSARPCKHRFPFFTLAFYATCRPLCARSLTPPCRSSGPQLSSFARPSSPCNRHAACYPGRPFVPPSPSRPPASLQKITTRKLLLLGSMPHQSEQRSPKHWQCVHHNVDQCQCTPQLRVHTSLQARVDPSISVSNLYSNATAVQNAAAPVSLPTFMINYTLPAPLAVVAPDKKSSATTFNLLPQLLLICAALLAL
jgi:hypothetical protein